MHADLEQGQGDGVHAVACEAAPSLGTKRFIYQGEGGLCGVTRRGCMRVEISFVGCLGATRGCHLVPPRVVPLRAVGGCKTFETRYLSGFKKIKSTFTCNLDA